MLQSLEWQEYFPQTVGEKRYVRKIESVFWSSSKSHIGMLSLELWILSGYLQQLNIVMTFWHIYTSEMTVYVTGGNTS